MKAKQVDLMIIGAGPVGLACAYLATLSGLSFSIIDKSAKPLQVGRADALNARTLQLFTIIDIFDEIYPLGKTCNTSSIWSKGHFISRQSDWWEGLTGCFHKHFLMIGQAYIEQLFDNKLTTLNNAVVRETSVTDIRLDDKGCVTTLNSGEVITSQYVIGADGSRSFVRDHFNIPFEITRPELTWAVVDGVIETDFEKVPEIIVFQNDTADVAWIPRERNIDRFYVRMEAPEFSQQQVFDKISIALQPKKITFSEIEWYSKFTVKESVAESYSLQNQLFLAGDAGHIHSVNGGQGLNTGLADAFNLIWKLAMVKNYHAPTTLLASYEQERKSVALEVVKTSAELVRATKQSATGKHAEDYVKIVERRAGYITGMGIQYGHLGERLPDFLFTPSATGEQQRIYQQLSYSVFTLLIFGEGKTPDNLPDCVRTIRIENAEIHYHQQYILVRPDGYIAENASLTHPAKISDYFRNWR